MQCSIRPRWLWLSCVLWVCGAQAQEAAFNQLYAPRPPAGSSFVRVVYPESGSVDVKVADGPKQKVGGKNLASTYAIVKGGQTFSVEVANRILGTYSVQADTFNTLVVSESAGQRQGVLVEETADASDALKATLRFFNLHKDCKAADLTLAPSGKVIFSGVGLTTPAVRAVNPVSASVMGKCGEISTAAQNLPPMQAGDHWSLFLSGSKGSVALHIQKNQTDPVKR